MSKYNILRDDENQLDKKKPVSKEQSPTKPKDETLQNEE